MDGSPRDSDIKLMGVGLHKIKICSETILNHLRKDYIMKNKRR